MLLATLSVTLCLFLGTTGLLLQRRQHGIELGLEISQVRLQSRGGLFAPAATVSTGGKYRTGTSSEAYFASSRYAWSRLAFGSMSD